MLRCGRGEKKFQSRKLLSYNNNEQAIKNKRKYTVHSIIITSGDLIQSETFVTTKL